MNNNYSHCVVFILILFSYGCINEEGIGIRVKPNIVLIEENALSCYQGIYGNVINGQSFQQDIIFSISGYQYTAYYNQYRELCLARRETNKNAWEVLCLDGYRFSNDSQFDNDTHNTISLGYCLKDGTLHIAFDTHSSPLNYVVSVKGLVTNPRSFKWNNSIFSPISNSLINGVPLNEFSYPSFVSTSQGDLLLGYRDGYSGILQYKISLYDGGTSSWNPPYVIIDGSGKYEDYFSGSSFVRGPYVNGLSINRQNGELFVSWTWREEIRSNTTSNRDIYASISQNNGKDWLDIQGKKIIPETGNDGISTETKGVIVRKLDRGWGLMNQQAQSFDRKGNPHIIMYFRKEWNPIPDFAKLNDGQFVHFYLKDTSWIENKIPFMGNRPKFVFNKQNDIYLIFLNKDHFDYVSGSGSLIILKASAGSNWTDWELIYKSEEIYFSEPLIDNNFWEDFSILNIFIQETPKIEGEPSRLKILEFKFD